MDVAGIGHRCAGTCGKRGIVYSFYDSAGAAPDSCGFVSGQIVSGLDAVAENQMKI